MSDVGTIMVAVISGLFAVFVIGVMIFRMTRKVKPVNTNDAAFSHNMMPLLDGNEGVMGDLPPDSSSISSNQMQFPQRQYAAASMPGFGNPAPTQPSVRQYAASLPIPPPRGSIPMQPPAQYDNLVPMPPLVPIPLPQDSVPMQPLAQYGNLVPMAPPAPIPASQGSVPMQPLAPYDNLVSMPPPVPIPEPLHAEVPPIPEDHFDPMQGIAPIPLEHLPTTEYQMTTTPHFNRMSTAGLYGRANF
jgi:hypothetical protein